MNLEFFLSAALLLAVKTAALPSITDSCNQTVSSLSEMLEMASGLTQRAPNFVLCVELNSTVEVLQYKDIFVPFSVVIRPALNGGRGTVSCNNSVELPLSDYQQFPLMFNASEFVVIESIDFSDCMRPVQILWAKSVTLFDVTFSNFSPAGALEISNSPVIVVESCQFTNNTSEGIGLTQYSGNSGGLSIGFDNNNRSAVFQNILPQIRVTDTEFINNTATAATDFQHDVSFVLKNYIFNQRGGAMAVYLGAPNYSAQILVQNCFLKGNVARDSGGGIYMNIQGDNNSHSINVTDTDFIDNDGPDGGGLEITQYSGISSDSLHHAVHVVNCQFLGNRGRFGGGYKSIQVFTYLNTVNLYNCTFINNTAQVGAALYLQSIYTTTPTTVEEKSIIQDCTFDSNSGNRGIVFVIQNAVGIRGKTLFTNNTGPSIRILHCLVSLGDELSFVGNRAHPEGFSGALYFSQYGQVLLKRGANISFINNTGNEGACIVVKGQLISSEFPQQLFNPQCFLQYEQTTDPPHQWNVTMFFEGNQAQVGPVIYISDIKPCQWFSEEQPFFSLDSNKVWPFMNMGDNYIIRGNQMVSRDDYIQTEVHSLLLPNITNVSAPPGSTVTLEAIALDQFNRSTSAFLELLNDEAITDDNVVFEPSIAQAVAGNDHISFTYRSDNQSGDTKMIVRASFISTEVVPMANLTLTHQLCLPGYSLDEENMICACRVDTNTVLFCLPDEQGIILADGLWGAPPSWSRNLVAYTCPSGYCSCSGDKQFQENEGCPLYYEDSDRICVNNRKGLLCGECRGDWGVGLLTNTCREYIYAIPQAYILLPVYLALLVLVLVVIVRRGIILATIFRGFLFYIQVSSIAVAYLPETFTLSTEVMDCIWSATALYVPYDFDFHASMTSLESYGLRYITPLVALIVVPIAARARRPHSKYWHGVWTIILLLYVRAIHTSISLLHCPTLHGELSTTETRTKTLWFFDGSVDCFQGAHLFLTLVALLVLAACVALIPIVAVIVYHRRIKRTDSTLERVEKLSVAITFGIKDEYKWWPVMELSCQFVFVTVVLLTPSFTFIPLILSLVFLVLQTLVLPYKNKWANVGEIFALVWLVILLALGNTTPIIIASKELEKFTLWPLFYFPVLVAAVVFIVVVTLQIVKWCKIRRHTVKKKLNKKSETNKQSLSYKFSNSLSFRSHLSTRRHVSTTVVGFDGDEEMDFELVNAIN